MMFALKGEAAKPRDAAAEFRLYAPDKTLSTWRKQAVPTSAAYKEWFENELCSGVARGGPAGVIWLSESQGRT
jgi:hypothetical protein